MKIIVDEIPKSAEDCVFGTGDERRCVINNRDYCLDSVDCSYLKSISDFHHVAHKVGVVLDTADNTVQKMPTVTKADIRAEVIDECIKEISTMECRDDYGLVYPHTVCNVLEMLKEKECKNI